MKQFKVVATAPPLIVTHEPKNEVPVIAWLPRSSLTSRSTVAQRWHHGGHYFPHVTCLLLLWTRSFQAHLPSIPTSRAEAMILTTSISGNLSITSQKLMFEGIEPLRNATRRSSCRCHALYCALVAPKQPSPAILLLVQLKPSTSITRQPPLHLYALSSAASTSPPLNMSNLPSPMSSRPPFQETANRDESTQMHLFPPPPQS